MFKYDLEDAIYDGYYYFNKRHFDLTGKQKSEIEKIYRWHETKILEKVIELTNKKINAYLTFDKYIKRVNSNAHFLATFKDINLNKEMLAKYYQWTLRNIKMTEKSVSRRPLERKAEVFEILLSANVGDRSFVKSDMAKYVLDDIAEEMSPESMLEVIQSGEVSPESDDIEVYNWLMNLYRERAC